MKLLEKLRKSSHTTDRTQTYVPRVYAQSHSNEDFNLLGNVLRRRLGSR